MHSSSYRATLGYDETRAFWYKGCYGKLFWYSHVQARSPLPTATLQNPDQDIVEKLEIVVDIEKSL